MLLPELLPEVLGELGELELGDELLGADEAPPDEELGEELLGEELLGEEEAPPEDELPLDLK